MISSSFLEISYSLVLIMSLKFPASSSNCSYFASIQNHIPTIIVTLFIEILKQGFHIFFTAPSQVTDDLLCNANTVSQNTKVTSYPFHIFNKVLHVTILILFSFSNFLFTLLKDIQLLINMNNLCSILVGFRVILFAFHFIILIWSVAIISYLKHCFKLYIGFV